jgi:hypothetical protein
MPEDIQVTIKGEDRERIARLIRIEANEYRRMATNTDYDPRLAREFDNAERLLLALARKIAPLPGDK